MIDGVVGKVLVSSGSVVHSGEPMIEIVGEHRFVVAWFPVSRLHRLQVGDAVTVSTGGASLPGQVAKVGVRSMRRLLYRQWRLQLGLDALALASISPPDSGLYRRNASGRQSGIRQMLCLLECSIVCGS